METPLRTRWWSTRLMCPRSPNTALCSCRSRSGKGMTCEGGLWRKESAGRSREWRLFRVLLGGQQCMVREGTGWLFLGFIAKPASLSLSNMLNVLYVCASEVSCPWKHVCVSVDQLYRQQWMGGCHVMIHAASVDAHLLPIQIMITVSESLVCCFKATQSCCSI